MVICIVFCRQQSTSLWYPLYCKLFSSFPCQQLWYYNTTVNNDGNYSGIFITHGLVGKFYSFSGHVSFFVDIIPWVAKKSWIFSLLHISVYARTSSSFLSLLEEVFVFIFLRKTQLKTPKRGPTKTDLNFLGSWTKRNKMVFYLDERKNEALRQFIIEACGLK